MAATTEQGVVCAVKADGKITCFGDSFSLQQVLPMRSGDWRRVFLTDDFGGNYNICALDAQGAATCWGMTREKQLGGSVRDIAVGQYGLFAVDDMGHIRSEDGESVKNTLGSEPTIPLRHIAINDNLLCALAEDGTLQAPLPFPSGRYLDFALSNGGACAINTDGQVVCSPDTLANPDLAHERFISIEQQDLGAACAITTSGSVRCWDGQTASQLSPPPDKFTRLAAFSGGMCGIRTDGTIACWGSTSVEPPAGF